MKCIISQLFKLSVLPPGIQLSLDPTEQKIVQFIRSAIDDLETILGHRIVVRICGGWVRDKLLGRPSKDIDLTVDTMGGDKFARYLYDIALQRYGANQKIVTEATNTEPRPDQIKNLEVAILRIFGQDVEILPLRGNEVYEEGNRNPVSTSAASPEDDAYRRDLTMNSMFYNVNEGHLEDFTGRGYDDLATMTLAHPSRPGHQPIDEANRILSEDPLRWLRYVRFLSRYANAQLDPVLLEAMKNPDIQHQVVRRLYGDSSGGIVPERTAEELRKIMMGDQPDKAIKIMFETGMLRQLLLLPQEYHQLDMDQRNSHHSLSVISHTIEVLKNANQLAKEFGLNDKQRMLMNFTALFHDIGKLDPRSHNQKNDGTMGYAGNQNDPNGITHQQASQDRWNQFAKALKLSDEETSSVSESVLNHMNPHAHIEETGGEVTDKTLRKYIRKNPAWVFQYIHAMADSMSKQEESNATAADPYRANLERLRSLAPGANAFGDMPPTQDLLRGPDIMAIVGLPPKPPQKRMTGYIEVIKETIRDHQDVNPQFTAQEATYLIQNLTNQGRSGQGILAVYFQNSV